MKAKDFPEANTYIAKDQEQYETLPANVEFKLPEAPVTMCFELDEEERKQVAETGEIWLKVLTFGNLLQPIYGTILKPENFE